LALCFNLPPEDKGKAEPGRRRACEPKASAFEDAATFAFKRKNKVGRQVAFMGDAAQVYSPVSVFKYLF